MSSIRGTILAGIATMVAVRPHSRTQSQLRPAHCAAAGTVQRQHRRVSSCVLNSVTESKLYQSYQVLYGEKESDMTQEHFKAVLGELGIIDQYIASSLFNMLANDDSKVAFKSFESLCRTLSGGSDEEKARAVFDMVDLDKSGYLDKFELATVIKHLLDCRAANQGAHHIYNSIEEEDMYFSIPMDTVTQLKANRIAHDMVCSVHGGERQGQMDWKMFKTFLAKNNKQSEHFKSLFDVLDVWIVDGGF